MMKRLAMVLVICALLVGICPAFAALSPAQIAADTLCDLGLFKGTGTDEYGNPIYDLDETPTRIQALIMMLRLFGLENNAMPGRYWAYPFDDVPDWAASYVGYAYLYGLSLGMSESIFGTDVPAEPNMYLTFVLRALKYADSGDNADFSYDCAGEFAKTVGLTDRDYDGGFYRADVAVISLRALGLKLKGTDTTLIQHLVDYRAVDAEAAKNAGFAITPSEDDVVIPVSYYQKYMYYFVNGIYIQAAFPSAVGVLHGENYYYPPEQLQSDTYSEKEMEFLWALRQSEALTNGNYSLLPDDWNPTFPLTYSTYYILDADLNILGVWHADEPIINMYIRITRGGEGVDGAKLYKEFLENPAILPAN